MIFKKLLTVTLFLAFLLSVSICGSTNFKNLYNKGIQDQTDFCQDIPFDHGIECNITHSYIRFKEQNFPIYVYRESDIVSGFIYYQHDWEGRTLSYMTNFLDNYMKKHGITNRQKVALLDIGANIGTYVVTLGGLGHHVYAFEPGKNNLYMLRKSVCEYPNMSAVILGYGLSNETSHCAAYADRNNMGNNVVICGKAAEHLVYIQDFDMYRLDEFADYLRNVVAIKIDVEGHEPLVVEGGKKIFLERKVPYIQMEFDIPLLREKKKDPIKFLKRFVDAGYHISLEGVPGVFLTTEQALDIKTYPGHTDLLIVHQSELDCFKVEPPTPPPVNPTSPEKPAPSVNVLMMTIFVIGFLVLMGVVVWICRKSLARRKNAANEL